MSEVLYKARGQVVRWNPAGILTVKQSIPYLLGVTLPWLFVGGSLLTFGLLADIEFQWTVLALAFGGLLMLLGGAILVGSGIEWYRRYPVIVDGLRSYARIGRRQYRAGELTGSEVERVVLLGDSLYALSVQTDHGKEYICRGVSESRLNDLHLVQTRLNEILRCASANTQSENQVEAIQESVFVGLVMLLTGALVAAVAWIGFPEYQFVSSRSTAQAGVYIWSVGLYIAYAGCLTLLRLPVWDLMQRRWTSNWKSYLALALLAAPVLAYIFFV
ncbi:MAG: hypothetical protein F9K24_02050 [Leptonema illini]|jgi:hypothetical protein|uniref:Uncharacterized protein n=1 Tax=Leptonema illini TaxID=183 RepID=A0A833H5M1_9LEPT|nr:MAG: hypothetical protein F9K24_02050 [Leptonema illini]